MATRINELKNKTDLATKNGLAVCPAGTSVPLALRLREDIIKTLIDSVLEQSNKSRGGGRKRAATLSAKTEGYFKTLDSLENGKASKRNLKNLFQKRCGLSDSQCHDVIARWRGAKGRHG